MREYEVVDQIEIQAGDETKDKLTSERTQATSSNDRSPVIEGSRKDTCFIKEIKKDA